MPTRPTTIRLATAVATILAAVAVGVVVTPSAASAATYTPPNLRQRIDLNTGWRFHLGDVSDAQATAFNDSSWSSVNVPHTWNAVDGADGGNNYFRGTGWYRRHFMVPASPPDKTLFLQFAGANQVADVWVNDAYLGQHRGS